MANEDTALREVDQELAEDRQWAMFRQHGPVIIGAAIAIVVFVGSWQFRIARQQAVAAEHALEFKNAIELLGEDGDAGRTALAALADGGAGGYALLSRMQEAASYARDGERLKAVEVYRKLAGNGRAPKPLRQLAQLRAAYFSLADGRDAVFDVLDGLQTENSTNGYYAKEILALSEFRAKDFETAFATFDQLANDVIAPAGIRERAMEFAALAAAGKKGVNVTGEARVEDLINSLGRPAKLPGDGLVADEVGDAADDRTNHDRDADDGGVVQRENSGAGGAVDLKDEPQNVPNENE